MARGRGGRAIRDGPPARGHRAHDWIGPGARTEEGWSADRQEGDAYTPNPAVEYGAALSPPSGDVHQLSAQLATDSVDPGLPARGGYNYQVSLPAGGYVQVYNAAFAPDGAGGVPANTCENGESVHTANYLSSRAKSRDPVVRRSTFL